MIIGTKLLCREQNLTEGEVAYFMGCRSLEEARAEIGRIKKKWEDVESMTGPLVVYGIACDVGACYVFTPEDLVGYMGMGKEKHQAERIYAALLERVKLVYCETEDKSDYYSILELYMDLGDILEA